ncbi:TPA: hypothetical protein EYP66_24245 [Candidatus Poribacteria bacterium]|nr:hypothetical protein [Candidatus Poribacteria bacterium]
MFDLSEVMLNFQSGDAQKFPMIESSYEPKSQVEDTKNRCGVKRHHGIGYFELQMIFRIVANPATIFRIEDGFTS